MPDFIHTSGEKVKIVRVCDEDCIMQRHDTLTLQGPYFAGTWTLVYFDTEEAIFLDSRKILSIKNDGKRTMRNPTDQELDSLYKMTYLVFGT